MKPRSGYLQVFAKANSGKVFHGLIFCIIAFHSISCFSRGVISVTVDKNSGVYKVYFQALGWSFSGSTGHALTGIRTSENSDAIGTYKETVFNWKDGISYRASIKWYKQKSVVIFTLMLPEGSAVAPKPFPSLTGFPKNMHRFSYEDRNFSPPDFRLNSNATPWLFFDDHLNAFLISPASGFMVSKLEGDGIRLIRSRLNGAVKNLPPGFAHSTILVAGHGIGDTWDDWGQALRAKYGRHIPQSSEDPVIRYFGYWTDNGAAYYYNYNAPLGYANTLLALRKRYQEEGIPLGYMQLDSWWYEKSIYDVDGKPDADHKNPVLPAGKWNRYGGLMSYTADTFLFPEGLASFQKKLGLPLVTHNRWIDPGSPYHTRFKISGFAAVDPAFWNHIIAYIKHAGVICYEQDWLNYIYDKSPGMQRELNTGNLFTDGMAEACKKEGLSMQYCMATPRYFLQGIKYNNLTTIRTSDDRFEPAKWRNFLYTSVLASECGMFPWCDVFKSRETGNMILAVLSAGPVGTGDSIGYEDKPNILRACRNDGVLVKPDVPILPVDQDYLDDAGGALRPMIARTYTNHKGIKTLYVFAFAGDSVKTGKIEVTPSKLGMSGNVWVYNIRKKSGFLIRSDRTLTDQVSKSGFVYYEMAPVTSSGIALTGDVGKFVPTGKQRIASIASSPHRLTVKVLFAEGESMVRLEGYSKDPIRSDKGKLVYASGSHTFSLDVPSESAEEVTVNLISASTGNTKK